MTSRLARSLTVGLLTCAAAAPAARAQEQLLPLPLEKMSVQDALAACKTDHRILVVVREWKRAEQGRRPWWANDTVRAWLMWHARLVDVSNRDVDGRDYLKNHPKDIHNCLWGVDVYVDGVRVPLLQCDPRLMINAPLPIAGIVEPCTQSCDPPAATGPEDWGTTNCVSPTGTAMLGQLDLQLQAGTERNPLWGQVHKLQCPEPERPGRLYWYGQEKDGLPRTTDISQPVKGERYVDIMARVRQADTERAKGHNKEALALLTWAWERGGDLDPGFALARVGVVLPRLAELREIEAPIAERLTKIADAEQALYPWFDDDEELGYLCLRAASEARGMIAQRLAVENLDLDEETMGAIVSARLGDLKARAVDLKLDTPPEADAWKAVLQAARRPLPRLIDAEPKERWARRRIELLTIAAVRPYGLLLASTDPDDQARAQALAEDVIKETAKSPPARRAAVLRAFAFAAASVDKFGENQRGWLLEAARINPPTEGAAGDPLMRLVSAPVK